MRGLQERSNNDNAALNQSIRAHSPLGAILLHPRKLQLICRCGFLINIHVSCGCFCHFRNCLWCFAGRSSFRGALMCNEVYVIVRIACCPRFLSEGVGGSKEWTTEKAGPHRRLVQSIIVVSSELPTVEAASKTMYRSN